MKNANKISVLGGLSLALLLAAGAPGCSSGRGPDEGGCRAVMLKQANASDADTRVTVIGKFGEPNVCTGNTCDFGCQPSSDEGIGSVCRVTFDSAQTEGRATKAVWVSDAKCEP